MLLLQTFMYTSLVAHVLHLSLSLLHHGHPSERRVVPHNCDSHFLDGWWCWLSFHVLLDHLCHLHRPVYSNPLSILNWVGFLLLNSKSSLCILDMRSVTWPANIFSHSMGCLFTFLIVYFDAQGFHFDESFHLFPPHLWMLMFLVTYLRNHCLIEDQENVPVSKNFIEVLRFVFDPFLVNFCIIWGL